MMPITDAEKEDVLTKVAIELERTFFILSNHYNTPELSVLLPYVREVESAIKTCVADLSPTAHPR